MKRLCTALLYVLLSSNWVAAQTDPVGQGRQLPQWLKGTIAVAAFLFLMFVAFLVNKAFCGQRSGETVGDYTSTNGNHYDTSMDAVRSSEHENAYENIEAQQTDNKVTVM